METSKTIDDILARLEAIITDSIETNNRLGYFAALYYKVTFRVKQGIANNEFEDGERMELLDVTFANRYLQAYDCWKKNEPVSQSWKIAFDATKKYSLLVLQHLLLGMNAHINLDLGIAAAEVAKGKPLQSIRNDFASINTVIASLTYEVINEIDRVSPLLSLLGMHAMRDNSILTQFSIDNARDGAWCFAEDLSNKINVDYATCIAERDKTINKLAGGLIITKGFLAITLFLVHLFEWKKPSSVTKVLRDYKKQSITINTNK